MSTGDIAVDAQKVYGKNVPSSISVKFSVLKGFKNFSSLAKQLIKRMSIVLALVSLSAFANAFSFTQPTADSSTNSSGTYTLKWSGGGSYQILRESINGGAWAIIANPIGGNASYSFTPPTKPNGTYSYWLQNFCSGGQAPVACGDITRTITVVLSSSSSIATSSSSSAASSTVTGVPTTSNAYPTGFGALPSFQLGKAELVSPTRATSLGLYSSTVSTIGSANRGVTAEIVDLANSIYALSHNSKTEFAQRAYNYVYSETAPEFRFGLSKGALGALLDKSGTPFDQAQLLKELLDAQSVPANYVIGEATLTGAQFQEWAGVATAQEACQLLANGGIPASVNGSSPADCNLSGAVSSVVLVHVWLDVTGIGTFDPSFKKMIFTPPAALNNYTGYNRTSFVNAIIAGANTSGVNAATVDAQLQTQAQSYYQAVNPKATTASIVGGTEIAFKKIIPTDTAVPYGAVSKLTVSSLPDQLRTKLSMRLYSAGSLYTVPLFADETYGRHLAFEPDVNPAIKDNGTCSLKFDGQKIVANFYVFGRLEFEINHPYLAKQPGTNVDNSYMDEATEFSVNCQLPTAIVLGYGKTAIELGDTALAGEKDTSSMQQKGTLNRADYRLNGISMGGSGVGGAAYRYLAESSQHMNFLGSLVQTTIERHHAIGLVGQAPRTLCCSAGFPYMEYSGTQLDVHNRVSASVRAVGAPSQITLGRSLSWLSSTIEGSALKHPSGGINAFSTAERFSWGVDHNVSFVTLMPGSVVPTLVLNNFPTPPDYVQYPVDDTAVATKLKEKVATYLNNGYTVTLPTVVILGPGELGGWSFHPGDSGSYVNSSFTSELGIQFGATFFAEKTATGEYAQIMVDQSGFSKGGGAPALPSPTLNAPKVDERQKIDTGVQKSTGKVNYVFKDVISLGGSGLPYGLGVNIEVKTKTNAPEYGYAGITSLESEHHYYRKSRMFEVTETGNANISSDSIKLLGVRTPLEAAPTVAAMLALLDINASTEPKAPVISALISRWLDRQADDNTINITSSRGSTEFVRQHNGMVNSYKPDPGSAETLSITGQMVVNLPVQTATTLNKNPDVVDWLKAGHRKINNYRFTRTFGDKSTEFFTNSVNSLDDDVNPALLAQVLNHFLTEYKNTSGVTVTYKYDWDSYLTSLKNSLGRALTFTNSIDTDDLHTLEITDESGRKVTVKEIAAGVSLTGIDGKVWTAQMQQTINAGSRPMLGWALTGILSPESSTDPMVKYQYDNNWRAVAVDLHKASGNNYWINAYKWALLPGNANAEIDSAGAVTADYFDGKGRVAFQVDPLGVKTLSSYDSWGRAVEKRVFPAASALKTIPNNSGWASTTDSAVYSNSYIQRTGAEYDDNSNKTYERLYPNAANASLATLETYRTYDSIYNKVATESFRYASGETSVTSVTNEYASATGLLKKSTTAAGLVTNYTYNTSGLPTEITEGSSSVVARKKVIEYDDGTANSFGNITKFTTSKSDGTFPVVINAEYQNKARGDLTKITDPKGYITAATYDDARRITDVSAPMLTGAKYYYTDSGYLKNISKKDGKGNFAVTSATLNPLGWMTSLTDASGHTQGFDYDARGLLLGVTDAESRKAQYSYNANGKLICQQDGYGTPLVRSYKILSYDDLGRINSYNPAKSDGNNDCVVDNNSYKTTVTYDAYGQQQKTIYPDSSYEQQTYNTNGTVFSKRTRKGGIISFSYDTANRVSAKVTSDYTTTYPQYDVFSHPLQITQGSSTLSFVYDYLDRLSSSTQNGRTVGIQYDNNNNRARVTWPDNYYVSYFYDPLNRMSTIMDSTNKILASYSYDANYASQDSLSTTTLAFGNGATVTSSNKPDDRLTTLTNHFTGSANDASYTYGYNGAHQLTSESLTNRNFHWRPKTTEGNSYAVNNLDQYTALDNGNGSINFGYDANGNLTSTGKGSFTYDAENKLVSAAINSTGPQGALNASYAYDANGRRTQKSVTISGATISTQYLSEGDNEIAEYLNGSSLASKHFIYGKNIDEIIAQHDVAANSYSYAHRDHEGSVIAVSDASGNVSSNNIYTYSAYGEPETAAGTGSAGFPYRYTGRRIDTETGLYYYRARYYDPQLGRFLQTDPIGYKDQMNLYAYVGNDPLNKTDPTGLTCEQNTDGTAKSCKIDQGGDKLSDTKREKFEGRMKNLANSLVNKKVAGTKITLNGPNGTKIHTTYGAMGRAIMGRTAIYDPNKSGAETGAGNKEGLSKGLQESSMTFGPDAINGTGINNGGSADRISSTIILHEAAHGTSDENNALNRASPLEKSNYKNEHQGEFNRTGQGIYDEINQN